MKGSNQKRYPFLLATVVLTAVALELVSFLFIRLYAAERYERLFSRDFRDYLSEVPDEKIERFRRYTYDPELGWDVFPGTLRTDTNTVGLEWTYSINEAGGRGPLPNEQPALLSAYGCSYTFGHEVDDDQTWPHYLSGLVDAPVLNFGVGTFGMDQAFLKLTRNFENDLRTPAVVYTVWSGNLPRLLNTYRPFFRPETGFKLGFKPAIVESGGGYRWLPNPLNRLRTRQDSFEALEKAKANDFWFQSRTISSRFPFVLRLVQLLGAILRGDHDRDNRLWEFPEATGRLAFLIDEFHRHSQQFRYLPILIFLPTAGELRGRMRGAPSPFAEFVSDVRTRYAGSNLVVVDLYDREFDEIGFNLEGRGSHPSPYGNQVVAAAIYEAIQPLLEELCPGKGVPFGAECPSSEPRPRVPPP